MAINIGDAVFTIKLVDKASSGVGVVAKAMGAALAPIKSLLGAVEDGARAMARGFSESVSSFSQFNQAITNTAAVSGLTGVAFERGRETLSKLAMTLGTTTVFSAKQAADALSQLAQLGFEPVNMKASDMKPIMDLAAASQEDLGRTTDVVSAALKIFGLNMDSAAKVSDIFALTNVKSAATTDFMGNALAYVGPVAEATGIKIEELSATIGFLANRGVEASTAGTSLRQIINALISPTAEAGKIIKSLGLEISDLNLHSNTLTEVFNKLKTAGINEAQVFDLFTARAAPAALSILDLGNKTSRTTKEINTFTKELQKSGGSAERIAKLQLNTLGGQFTLLKSKIETLAIKIGSVFAPALKTLVEFASKNADAFGKWLDKGIKPISKELEKLTTKGLKEFSKWMKEFTKDGPSLKEVWEKIKDGAAGVWEKIKLFLGGITLAFGLFKALRNEGVPVFEAIGEAMQKAAEKTGLTAFYWTSLVYDNVMGMANAIFGLIQSAAGLGEMFKPLSDALGYGEGGEDSQGDGSGALGIIGKLLFAKFLLKFGWPGAIAAAGVAFLALSPKAQKAFDEVVAKSKSAMEDIKTGWENPDHVFGPDDGFALWAVRAGQKLRVAWDETATAVKAVWEGMKTAWADFTLGFQNPDVDMGPAEGWDAWFMKLGQFARQGIAGLKQAWQEFTTWFGSEYMPTVEAVWDSFKLLFGESPDWLDNTLGWIKDKWVGLVEWVQGPLLESLKAAWSAIKVVFSSVSGAIQGAGYYVGGGLFDMQQLAQQSNASGGVARKSGWSRINEVGQETILRQGDRVLTASQTKSVGANLMSGGGISVNINGPVTVRSDRDIPAISKGLFYEIRDDLRRKGVG